jgi:hypothetical protein
MTFAGYCKAHRLNPFAQEVYLSIIDGKPVITTAYQTFMRRAEGFREYQGYRAGIVVMHDAESGKDPLPLKGEPDIVSPPFVAILGSICPPGYAVIGGWCRVQRSDRTDPIVATVDLEEYIRYTKEGKVMRMWKPGTEGGKQATMIRKTGIAHAFREAFPALKGMYIEDELSGQGAQQPAVSTADAASAAAQAAESAEVVFPEELVPLFDALDMNQGAREMFMGEMAALQKTLSEQVEVLKGRIAERAAAVTGALTEGRPLERLEIVHEQRESEPVAVATTHDGQMKLA